MSSPTPAPDSGVVTLEIDGVVTTVAHGTTLLEAATSVGVQVPTLCHGGSEASEPSVSCLLCVVEVEGSQHLLASCGTRAEPGMVVRTHSDRVQASRRTCLELLLSDHAGTCLGPCTMGCPAQLDVCGFLDLVRDGDSRGALRMAREALVLPAALGVVCAGHCESACVRDSVDSPVAVRRLHGHLAELDLAKEAPDVPECAPETGRAVAVIGGGPAGLAVAFDLRRAGVRTTVVDAGEKPGGGLLTREPAPDPAVIEAEIGLLGKMGVRFACNERVATPAELENLLGTHDAVVLAFGAGGTDLGLDRTRRGVKLSDGLARTSREGVFATGAAVSGPTTAIRAVASGKKVADAVVHWLRDESPTAAPWYFRAKMSEGEAARFFADAPAGLGVELKLTLGGPPTDEAGRCLECACPSHAACRLRILGARYGANPGRYRGERRELGIDRSHPLVDYEAGKCILCGLCLEPRPAPGKLGLTLVGRGFSARIGPPFSEPFAAALGEEALVCADVCPSGAIARKAGAR